MVLGDKNRVTTLNNPYSIFKKKDLGQFTKKFYSVNNMFFCFFKYAYNHKSDLIRWLRYGIRIPTVLKIEIGLTVHEL